MLQVGRPLVENKDMLWLRLAKLRIQDGAECGKNMDNKTGGKKITNFFVILCDFC